MSNIQILFPFLSKFYFFKILVIILVIGIFLEKRLIENIKMYFSSRQLKTLMFFVFWMLMSVPLGAYPGGSFSFLTQEYWKTLVVFFIVLAYVETRKEYENMIWIYILAGGLLGLLTIMTSSGPRLSISSDIYDANDTALQFIVVLPFVIWKYISSAGTKKILSGIISLFILIGIVLTQSRGGFIGMVAVITVTIIQIRRLEKGKLKILLPALAVCCIALYFGSSEYFDRISTVFDTDKNYNYSSPYGRINVWKRGLEMMVNNPLLGVGVAGYMAADGFLFAADGARFQAAHNSFVQVGAELGFPGLLVFCYLIYSLIKEVRQIASRKFSIDQFYVINSYPIIGAWVGFIATAFFLSAAYAKVFYFQLAIAIVFIGIFKRRSNNMSQDINVDL